QMENTYNHLITMIKNDPEVSKYTAYTTHKCHYVNDEGLMESLMIESGDFSAFPLNYIEGNEPRQENDLALSYLNAKDLDKKVGDSLQLIVAGEKRTMYISGIYQD